MVFYPNYGQLLEECKSFKRQLKAVFYFLIPYLESSLYDYIISPKIKNRGRKPNRALITTFLKVYFYLLDDPKSYTIEDHFRGCFYRLLKILYKGNLLELFHQSLLIHAGVPSLLITDASHIRSVMGLEVSLSAIRRKAKRLSN